LTYYVAFLSDIHSNLPALKAVVKSMEGKRIDYVAFLGDLVGYYPWPNEVCEIASHLFDYAIMGNHDYSIVNNDFAGYNYIAKEADTLNLKAISSRCLHYLSSLKIKFELRLDSMRILMVHGSPSDPLFDYVYPEDVNRLESNYDAIALGHTHVQFQRKLSRSIIFNPGSVGQPRDGDPRAAYSLVRVRDDEISVDMLRVKYDVINTARAVLEAGYPRFLAQRLLQGM